MATKTIAESPVIHWQWALVVALGIPLLFAAYSAYPLLTGTTVVLEIRPVDPFDIFRGQYMVLAYDISTITLKDAHGGDTIYVSLSPDQQGISRATRISKEKPTGVFLTGKVIDTGFSSANQVRVEYGIEQWFFERNAEFSQQNLTAEIKVASDGRARIKQLLQNGKPLKITYKKPGLYS